MQVHLRTLCAALPLLLGACAGTTDESNDAGGPQGAETPEAGTAAPAPAVEFDVSTLPQGLRPAPNLICAGQISPEQMDALAAAGVARFVTLRVAAEPGTGWEEAHAAEQGYAFDRIEVKGAPDITDANATALHDLVTGTDGTTIVYCGSSNRVGALLGLAKARVEGASAEEALEFARQCGVTRLEPVLAEQLGD